MAGLLEIVWSVALDEAHKLTEPGPSIIGIGTAVLSLALLSRALRSLPVGTAYAAWVGIGAVGVAAVGTLALGEPFTWAEAFCIGLIIAGVVGVNTDGRASPRSERADEGAGGTT